MKNLKKPMYTHKELAILYFPNITPQSASSQLTRWIRRDPDLMDELNQAGYIKQQRMFTPLQLEILLDHLGEPDIRQEE